MSYKEQIDTARLPRHVAIIMDGNGRWAKKQGLARMFGHKKGVETVHNITVAATKLGIENRPKEEVDALMTLLVDTIAKETPTLMNNNVRLQTIGDINRLPEGTKQKFLACIDQTSRNTGLTMVIALSYSARWEIIEAVREAVRLTQAGQLRPEDVTEQMVSSLMTTREMPDPDLLIRTSGEYRISNFLLWQLAYSELYFTDCLWPEFTDEEFYKAIVDYQKRERRFGKTSEQIH